MDIHISVVICTLRETCTAVCLKRAVASDIRYLSHVFTIKQMNGPSEISLEGHRGEKEIQRGRDRERTLWKSETDRGGKKRMRDTHCGVLFAESYDSTCHVHRCDRKPLCSHTETEIASVWGSEISGTFRDTAECRSFAARHPPSPNV